MFKQLNTIWTRGKRPVLAMAFVALAAVGFTPAAMAFGNTSKILVVDNSDATVSGTAQGVSSTGTWTTVYFDNLSNSTNLSGPPYGTNARYVASSATETATFAWYTGQLFVGPGGAYTIEAFMPDDTQGNLSNAQYTVQRGSSTSCSSSTWTTIATLTGDQQNSDGAWIALGSVTFDQPVCYRVVLSNIGTAGSYVWADAMRFQRAYEHKLTIPDMPTVSSSANTAEVLITSSTGATPTQIRQLIFTCPANGYVLVTGSGESVANSNAVGYMGLAYSIAKDSTAADINNVIQSSAQSEYNGDQNRDFLSIQRFDSCTKGQSITYNLVGYKAQAQTTSTSYIWNARLSAIYTP